MKKFKLIELDNKDSYGQVEVGEIGYFEYYGGTFFFRSLRSSTVESIVRIENRIEVQTRNSKYVFVGV